MQHKLIIRLIFCRAHWCHVPPLLVDVEMSPPVAGPGPSSATYWQGNFSSTAAATPTYPLAHLYPSSHPILQSQAQQQHHYPNPSTLATADPHRSSPPIPDTHCHKCSELLPTDEQQLEEHYRQCLDGEGATTVTCPICGVSFPDALATVDRETHIDKCCQGAASSKTRPREYAGGSAALPDACCRSLALTYFSTFAPQSSSQRRPRCQRMRPRRHHSK